MRAEAAAACLRRPELPIRAWHLPRPRLLRRLLPMPLGSPPRPPHPGATVIAATAMVPSRQASCRGANGRCHRSLIRCSSATHASRGSSIVPLSAVHHARRSGFPSHHQGTPAEARGVAGGFHTEKSSPHRRATLQLTTACPPPDRMKEPGARRAPSRTLHVATVCSSVKPPAASHETNKMEHGRVSSISQGAPDSRPVHSNADLGGARDHWTDDHRTVGPPQAIEAPHGYTHAPPHTHSPGRSAGVRRTPRNGRAWHSPLPPTHLSLPHRAQGERRHARHGRVVDGYWEGA